MPLIHARNALELSNVSKNIICQYISDKIADSASKGARETRYLFNSNVSDEVQYQVRGVFTDLGYVATIYLDAHDDDTYLILQW